jgi:glutamine cyclotransferase
LCDEAQRWVLRLDPATGRLETLDIDWSPARRYFSPEDRNASFEGIAVGRGRLYLANERTAPAIVVVDLQTLRIVETFQPRPFKGSLFGTHFSDLCWAEDRLWVLCRQHRVILEINPATRDVMAEYDYEQVEEGLGYRKAVPAGLMEGLAVEKGAFWLITDNNGWPRNGGAKDLRPTLVRCPRGYPLTPCFYGEADRS